MPSRTRTVHTIDALEDHIDKSQQAGRAKKNSKSLAFFLSEVEIFRQVQNKFKFCQDSRNSTRIGTVYTIDDALENHIDKFQQAGHAKKPVNPWPFFFWRWKFSNNHSRTESPPRLLDF